MPSYPLVTLRPEYKAAAEARADSQVIFNPKGGQRNVSASKQREEKLLGAYGHAAFAQFLWYPPPGPEDLRKRDVGPFDVKTTRVYTWRTGHIVGGDLLVPAGQSTWGKDYYVLLIQLPKTVIAYSIAGYIEASEVQLVGKHTKFRSGGECLAVQHKHLHDMPDDPSWRREKRPW